jgi:hypothetical protein
MRDRNVNKSQIKSLLAIGKGALIVRVHLPLHLTDWIGISRNIRFIFAVSTQTSGLLRNFAAQKSAIWLIF